MLLRRGYLAFSLSLALVLGAAAPARADLSCANIPTLTSYAFQKHIKFHELTPELQQRTAKAYVERMDPQRVLFLAKDARRWQEALRHVFQEAAGGDCSRLQDLRKELIARNREAQGFIRSFVGGDDYALDESAELLIDPQKRGWPTTKEQQAALLRTLAHFQISNYMSSGIDLAEARHRLIHRYALRTRRASELTQDDLYSGFMDSFARSLDPHSSYFSADALEDFQIQMQLSLEGIGVALSEQDGYAVVEEIIPGGAADRIDILRPKDRIIAVADEGKQPVDVIDMALRDVVHLIRGKKGSRVQLSVIRQAKKSKRFQVTIVRDTIDLEDQAASLHMRDLEVGGRNMKLAVINLPSFYGDRDPTKRQGSRDVHRLLDQAKSRGAEGLVLDVSRNGGGQLEDAVTLTGLFINQGGIVAVRGENARRHILADPDKRIVWSGPMVVLTTRVTASASEILAGAVQDYHRAVVVGDGHTFGKGTVQSVLPLRRGWGALKVTTGMFFRPGGFSTQLSGVPSDVVVPSLFASDTFGEATQPYSLPPKATGAFLSERANGAGPSHFTPITPKVIAELDKRSLARVEKDPFFNKVEEQLAKRKQENGVVHLTDLMARQEADKGAEISGGAAGVPGSDTASADAPSAEPGSKSKDKEGKDQPSPQVQEALHILADLIQLQQ